ncbi:uncharacterized protein LOC130252462 [Oenanthe melanoleuca]|uniref:uncharacterized protein LOC130252462 n=1 Tax=Oenanthe melanoleuca TaxID=2939378 RepID=UPI0024C1A501|nr:uncharacterized protein LOC130252462 [Oenanthe melanoleuca]
MAAATTFLVLLLALLLKQTQDLRADVATAQRMWQRQNFLYHGVKKLLQDIRWSRSPQEAPLLSGSQLCLFWAAAAVMVLEICWLAWQMKSTLCTCHEQDSSGGEEEEGEEKEEKLKEQGPRVRLLSVPTLLPVQGLSDMCRDVKKMTLDVLRVCRALSKNTFMPELHPAASRTASTSPGASLRSESCTSCWCPCSHPPGTPSGWSSSAGHTCQRGAPTCEWCWSAAAREPRGTRRVSCTPQRTRSQPRPRPCCRPCARAPTWTWRKWPAGCRTRCRQPGSTCPSGSTGS